MNRLIAILFIIFVTSIGFASTCGCASTQRQEGMVLAVNAQRPIKVFLESSIDEYHSDMIKSVLPHFKQLPGVKVELTRNNLLADVFVYNVKIDPSETYEDVSPNETVLGFWQRGSDRIFIDISAMTNDKMFKLVFMHELCHWFGMSHVCKFINQKRNCSPVGYGQAIMDPVVDLENSYDFTELDLAEFRRIFNEQHSGE